MRKLGLIAVFLSTICLAQTIDDIGKVALGVKVLPEASAETHGNHALLIGRLRGVVTTAGYSSTGMTSFLLTPNVTINSIDVAEGGMKSITIVNGDLSLQVQDAALGTVYASQIIPFRGSGTNLAKAITSGLQGVQVLSAQKMLSLAKGKILEYYKSRKDIIFSQAETYAFNQKFDEAIACLMTIPEELFDIHSEALSKAIDIYKERNNYWSKQDSLALESANNAVLVKARSLNAMHKPQDALHTLWDYTIAQTSQDKEYYTLLREAERQISAEELAELEQAHRKYLDAKEREAREWELHVEKSRNEMNLEKTRAEQESARIANRRAEIINEGKQLDNEGAYINAVKNVALKYIETQSNNYNL